jgi:CheY-like chemotaxis protein
VDVPADLPEAHAHIVPLQQAILHLTGLIAESFPGGTLTIHGAAQTASVDLTFAAESSRPTKSALPTALADGIALTRQVVETCDGALAAEWKRGKFTSELILKTGAQKPVVLAVDDNQDTLLLLERYLANSPYTFVGTSHSTDALSLLERHHPVIVILDVMLPETDGWSLLAQVKQHPQGSSLPVIISTILPQEKLAHMLGADAFLKKPFTAKQLFDVFEKTGV